jgi:lysophospholipase
MNRLRKYFWSYSFILGFFVGNTVAFAGEADKSSESARLDTVAADKILSDRRFALPPDWKWGYFKNADAASIRYGFGKTKTPLGAVVLLPGFTEFAEVYFETASVLMRKGFDVYAMDWRGAGGSERFKKSDRTTSFGFEHDVDDLDQLINVIVKQRGKSKLPVFLVAHSFGSIVALRYLHDHPKEIAGAVISAPPLTCPGATAPPLVVLASCSLMVRLNEGDEFVPGQGNWEFIAGKVSKMSSHSHDSERVKLEEAWATANPKLSAGGATWRWLLSFQESCDKINDRNYTGEIETPILLGCATDDRIANPDRERQLAQSLSQCVLTEVKGARHDLFLESDMYRSPWMSKVEAFLKQLTVRRSSQQSLMQP